MQRYRREARRASRTVRRRLYRPMQLGIVDLLEVQVTINPYRPQCQLEEGACASNVSSGRLSWPRPTVKSTDRAVQTGQPPRQHHSYAER